MKFVYTYLNLFLVLLIAGCGGETVDSNELVARKGVVYKVNSEIGFTGTAVGKYLNGQQKEEVTFKDGKCHGESRSWYANGQKEEEVTFKDGMPDKYWRKWFENGQQKQDWNFRDGKRHGLHKSWDKNGQIRTEEVYENDINTEKKEWNADGQLIAERETTDKTYDKTFIYADNGQLIYTSTKADGQRRTQEWFENGQRRSDCNWKDGEYEGLSTSWYENGNLWLKSNYKNGVKNGPQASWYEYGQRESEETYKDGKLFGPSTYWDMAGTKRKEIVNDTGTWLVETNWNASGQKESQYTLNNGKRNGLATLWHSNGQKKAEYLYKDGKKVAGKSKFWDESGKPSAGTPYFGIFGSD